jgi:post-segregation antitoxin (ccd killing protein)
MQITVTIPDELAARIQARGLAVETYLRDLVEDELSHEPWNAARHRNAVEAMLHFADKHGAILGGDLKATIHEEH